MSNTIKLKRGLDIQLFGAAERLLTDLPMAKRYALVPSNFVGVTPKLLVKAGDEVKAGTPLFFDKSNKDVLFVSPVSGIVEAVVRGDKRKIMEIVVVASALQEYDTKEVSDSSRESVIQALLSCGLWPMIIQRPFGVIANQLETPKSIFISSFDSAPLAADMNYVLEGEQANLQKGIDVLRKLTDGKVHLSMLNNNEGIFGGLSGVEKHLFEGPHPAGNVGVQIHNIDPINKGEVVWTVDIQNLAIIGRLFATGKVDMRKKIALTGSELNQPKYVSVIAGAPIETIVSDADFKQTNVRVINGNVLSGAKVAKNGYLGLYNNQITVIPEGDKVELFGWAMPRLDKMSVSRGYFSWLMPKRKYALDTNLNGGERPFILSGLYEKYLPMDIYPVYLLKAILAGDIDKMENLGIYEIIDEDLALCEFVDPSKIEMQQILRDGITTMIKELS